MIMFLLTRQALLLSTTLLLLAPALAAVGEGVQFSLSEDKLKIEINGELFTE